MKRYEIDCWRMASFADFIEAVNIGLVRTFGGEWDGNLDALNDYLSWPKAEAYELEILGSENCARQLGHTAMAQWLRNNLQACHPSNRQHVEARLEQAQQGRGQTLFELVREIIEDNSHVRLFLT